jgi:hypothetical protein
VTLGTAEAIAIPRNNKSSNSAFPSDFEENRHRLPHIINCSSPHFGLKETAETGNPCIDVAPPVTEFATRRIRQCRQ